MKKHPHGGCLGVMSSVVVPCGLILVPFLPKHNNSMGTTYVSRANTSSSQGHELLTVPAAGRVWLLLFQALSAFPTFEQITRAAEIKSVSPALQDGDVNTLQQAALLQPHIQHPKPLCCPHPPPSPHTDPTSKQQKEAV